MTKSRVSEFICPQCGGELWGIKGSYRDLLYCFDCDTSFHRDRRDGRMIALVKTVEPYNDFWDFMRMGE